MLKLADVHYQFVSLRRWYKMCGFQVKLCDHFRCGSCLMDTETVSCSDIYVQISHELVAVWKVNMAIVSIICCLTALWVLKLKSSIFCWEQQISCIFDLVVHLLLFVYPLQRFVDFLPGDTGCLFYEYCRILTSLQGMNPPDRKLFWLFENVASMQRRTRDAISRHLNVSILVKLWEQW